MIPEAVKSALARIEAALRGTVARGTVKRASESGGVQRVQVEVEERLVSDVEHVQPFGFASRPKTGSRALVVRLKGDPGAPLVLVVDDERYRVTVSEGEAAVHNAAGDKVHVKASGVIEVVASSKVVVNAPAIELGEGATEAVPLGTSLADLLKGHTHTFSGTGTVGTSTEINAGIDATLSASATVK
jgi:phage gp45-like